MDAEFLEILVCPQTHQSLRLASEVELTLINASVAAGTLRNQGGNLVEQALTAGLVRHDGRVIYPIRDEIPVLLAEEAIQIPTANA